MQARHYPRNGRMIKDWSAEDRQGNIPPAVGIGSFNRDPTGSASPTRSPLGRG
jgi:hypothetical protein